MKEKPIGFFDSGMGGLSVMAEARRLLPQEDFLYYADTAHVPFGNRSNTEIYQYTMNGVMYLLGRGAKAVVLACNTATNVGVGRLRRYLETDITGIEPAVKPAFEALPEGKILVLTTYATFKQEKFHQLINRFELERMILQPMEDLAQVIEEHYFEPDEIDGYLKASLGEYPGKVGGVVLGCTHYILVREAFERLFGGSLIVDGNEGTVRNLIRKLESRDGLRNDGHIGSTQIVTTLGSRKERKLYLSVWDDVCEKNIHNRKVGHI